MAEALVVWMKNVGREAGLVVRNQIYALDKRDVGKRYGNPSDSLVNMAEGSEMIFCIIPVTAPDGSDGKYP